MNIFVDSAWEPLILLAKPINEKIDIKKNRPYDKKFFSKLYFFAMMNNKNIKEVNIRGEEIFSKKSLEKSTPPEL